MSSKLIRLKDGTLVQVEVDENEARPISNRSADRVNAAIDGIHDTILKACKPIASVWRELNKDLIIDQAEVELGLGFEAEGNLYITKAKGNANLVVRLTLKPNIQSEPSQEN